MKFAISRNEVMKRQFAKNMQARCLAAIELLGAIVGELENSGCDAAGQEKSSVRLGS